MCSIAFMPHKSRHDAEVPIWQVPHRMIFWQYSNLQKGHSILEVAPTVTTNTTRWISPAIAPAGWTLQAIPEPTQLSKISKGHNMMPLKAGGYKIGVSPIRNTDSLMGASDIHI